MVKCTELLSHREIRRIRDYLVLDMETTGPDPDLERILALGMVRVSAGEVVNTNSTLVNPQIPIPVEASRAAGIRDADVARAPTYAQLAPSIFALLKDAVVVADAADMDFVASMLEEAGCKGELRFLDVRHYAASILPDLKDDELSTLAEYFDLQPEGGQRILRHALLRHEILRACQARAEQQAAQRAQAAKARDGKSSGKNGRRRKKKRAEPLTGEESLWCAAAVLSLIAGIIHMPSWASPLFFLCAVICCPLRPLRRKLKDWGLTGWKLIALAAAVFLLAFLIRPTPESRRAQKTTDANKVPAYIILSWDEPGTYGKEITVDETVDPPETEIAFYIPPGIYRVLNNNTSSATVSVKDDPNQEPDPAYAGTFLGANTNSSITVLGNKSQELTVYAWQYVTLSEGSHKVIFQYLSEIPEVVEETEVGDPNVVKQPKKIAYVNGTDVRMRRNPSVDAFIMTTYDTGKEVVVTGTVGEWTAVTVDNRTGYIFSKYLSDTNPLTTPATEAPAATEEPAATEAPAAGEAAAETPAETEAPAAG